MKFYFDNLDINDSNLKEHQQTDKTDYWIIAPGAPIKKIIMGMGLEVDTLDNYNGPGCYYIDVRGDPQWWAGVLKGNDVPTEHVLHCVPQNLLELVRNKKLRLIIAADREGGPMVTNDWDCFRSTTDAIRSLKLPKGSVIIAQGNEKIERQYRDWIEANSEDKLFDVIYSNHFGHIFLDSNVPSHIVVNDAIANSESKDFNSLNRVYRPQRGAHLFRLAKDKILDRGLVSANQIDLFDREAISLAETSQFNYGLTMKRNYPKFVDGDWSTNNAANQYNVEIYKNSLMSVITETIFIHDVSFVTEKIFKPITMGHPLILFASQGTLKSLESMGFRIDWCGIDPKYNDIQDPIERFKETQKILMDWVSLSREDKIDRIKNSMDTIEHNFNHIRSVDFYKEAISKTMQRSEEYFNETV
jgi:hypothetical protein